MAEFAHISIADVAADPTQYRIVDIRDPNAFAAGHMPGAERLTNENITQFVEQTPPEQPVVVVCYHGVSSQQAAQYLAQQGFSAVYSMDGGFETWRLSQPVVTGEA